MADSITIRPSGPINAAVRPPGSKSITNRALVCAALAEGHSTLTGVLDSEDTQVMLAALRRLGLEIEFDSASATARVTGSGGDYPHRDVDLFVANSGTTMRFLTAALTVGNGRYRLSGIARMHQRPIRDLVDALRSLGATLRYAEQEGYPPLEILATGLVGGTTRIRGDVSSQFLSGLLMASPCARGTVEIEVEGPLVSRPYVDMTLSVMRAFGVDVDHHEPSRYLVPAPTKYHGTDYQIEPDASAASYFWAAAAITGGSVTVHGLGPNALQGDVAFCDCLEKMGCIVQRAADSITVIGRPLNGIDVNMNAISDTVQTLAAVALFASGPTTIRGVAHIRFKETDRIGDLARELCRLGAEVTQFDDGLRITPRPLHAAEIETYNDHRMAMSLALVGLRVPNVRIRDPQCTRKTYPRFFDDLQQLCAPDRP